MSLLSRQLSPRATDLVRVVLGFAIAPLSASIPAVFLAALRQPQPVDLFEAAAASSVFAYPATILLGFPGFAFLRRRRLNRWRHFAVLGAVIGALSVLLLAGGLLFFAGFRFEHRAGAIDVFAAI